MASRRPSWRNEALNVYEVREVKGDIRIRVWPASTSVDRGDHRRIRRTATCYPRQLPATSLHQRSFSKWLIKDTLTAASERATGFLCFFSSTSQVRSTTGTPL